MKNKKHSLEIKLKAIADYFAKTQHGDVKAIAQKYGTTANNIQNWRRNPRLVSRLSQGKKSEDTSTALHNELLQLKNENAQLRAALSAHKELLRILVNQ